VVPVNAEGVQKLRNARAYIVDLQTATAYKWPINTADSQEWKDLEDAYNVLDTLADETPECDCGGHRVSSRELPYFNPPFENYKGESPEDIRKYCRQDYDRMESLNNGNWGYIGIRAEAEVQVSDVVQDITSGGLWGIESDSDKSYLAEIDAEELASLKSELLALGFSRRAISQAFKSAVEVSE
jgi:hypothetical protein